MKTITISGVYVSIPYTVYVTILMISRATINKFIEILILCYSAKCTVTSCLHLRGAKARFKVVGLFMNVNIPFSDICTISGIDSISKYQIVHIVKLSRNRH